MTDGKAVEPIAWLWYNISNVTYGWTAASYLSSFVVYGATSVVEVVGWALYLSHDEPGKCFFRWYSATIGYWFMLYGGMVPWISGIL